ncbi:MAG: cation:proton antiporter [Pseudomonadales bacterium]|jgi:Kef-type K+ transport system membrane component KefB|nr:cation:proton antiporter [Pseudomonadales bacterium]
MELLYVLLVLLVVARLFAEVAQRLGQAPLVGELLAGVTLGVLVHRFSGEFPVLADLADDEVFGAITDLGIFFLMLLAGMELRPAEMARASARALWIAIAGMILPLVVGFGLGWIYLPDSPYRIAQCLFLAVSLAVTAVPVAVRVLRDLGHLDSELGRTVVSAAVVDDVFSLVLLAVLTAVIESGTFPDAAGIALLLGKVGLFFVVAVAVGVFVFPRVAAMLRRAKVEEFEFTMLLVVALGYAVLAEALDLHFILGAFLAGLFFGRRTVLEDVYEDVRKQLNGVTTGFLAPVFFTSIGLHLTGAALFETPVFVIVLILAAVLSKLLGGGLAARMTGMAPRDAAGVGFAMSARGAVELIIADIALRAGLFQHPDPVPAIVANLFSAVVIMAITTTILAPLALRAILPAGQRS